MTNEILALTHTLPGKIGWYYKNLVTGKMHEHNSNHSYQAASVIKLSVLQTIFQEIHEGKLKPDHTVTINREDQLPSCGALTYFHTPLSVTVKDLYRLMIVLSDNTATNKLIQLVGMQRVNQVIRDAGLHQTRLNRILFDAKAQGEGKENTFSPLEAGLQLESIYRGNFVSPAFSKEAEEILLKQQLKNKIPAKIPRHIPVAHKTGEDTGITHDVGIVYAKEPFVLCLAANETDVIETEEAYRQMTFLFLKLA